MLAAIQDAATVQPTCWPVFIGILTSRLHAMDDLPKLTKSTAIGIVIAISGNILISLALNLQKLAHKRVQAESGDQTWRKSPNRQESTNTPTGNNGRRTSSGRVPQVLSINRDARPVAPVPVVSPRPILSAEPQSTVPFPQNSPPTRSYGTQGPDYFESSSPARKARTTPWYSPRRIFPKRIKLDNDNPPLLPVDIVQATPPNPSPKPQDSRSSPSAIEGGDEAAYLKSKLWWMGFLLMNVGEIGNFISYAWAPASVVAPLGTFSLMANCIFAPVLLKERFRKRDLLAILIAIIGAVTVVLASNSSDQQLDPDTLIKAISQTPFIVYSCIYLAGAIFLATLSQSRAGDRWVFIDVGLCALFGGFTVLSTKAISTLLTRMGWIGLFSSWIAYPVLVVLITTGVGQIKYLNRALMRFDSKVVIPTQFVLFTLSAIIGSAILYGDFRKAKFHQIVTFLYGCAATFLGVFIIAWGPASTDDEEDEEAESGTVDPSDRRSITSQDSMRGRGSISKRRRAKLIIPDGIMEPQLSRSPRSTISLIGISPAQHLLLVHTPPREVPIGLPDGPERMSRRTSLLNTVQETSHPGTRDGSRTRHSRLSSDSNPPTSGQ